LELTHFEVLRNINTVTQVIWDTQIFFFNILENLEEEKILCVLYSGIIRAYYNREKTEGKDINVISVEIFSEIRFQCISLQPG
jgi:hypothetical protein